MVQTHTETQMKKGVRLSYTLLVRSLRCLCPLCLEAAGITPFDRSTNRSQVKGTREDQGDQGPEGCSKIWHRAPGS